MQKSPCTCLPHLLGFVHERRINQRYLSIPLAFELFGSGGVRAVGLTSTKRNPLPARQPGGGFRVWGAGLNFFDIVDRHEVLWGGSSKAEHRSVKPAS